MAVVDTDGALPCHYDTGSTWDSLLVGFLWPQEDAQPGLFRADLKCQTIIIPGAAINQ